MMLFEDTTNSSYTSDGIVSKNASSELELVVKFLPGESAIVSLLVIPIKLSVGALGMRLRNLRPMRSGGKLMLYSSL